MILYTLVYWFFWFAAYSVLALIFKRPGRTFAYWVGLTLVIHFGAIGVLKYQLMSRCDQFESPVAGALPGDILVLRDRTPTKLMKHRGELSQWRYWDRTKLEEKFRIVIRGWGDKKGQLVSCGDEKRGDLALEECVGKEVVNVSVSQAVETGSWSKVYLERVVVWVEALGAPQLLAEWGELTMVRRHEWILFFPFGPTRIGQCSTNGQAVEEWLIDLTRE